MGSWERSGIAKVMGWFVQRVRPSVSRVRLCPVRHQSGMYVGIAGRVLWAMFASSHERVSPGRPSLLAMIQLLGMLSSVCVSPARHRSKRISGLTPDGHEVGWGDSQVCPGGASRGVRPAIPSSEPVRIKKAIRGQVGHWKPLSSADLISWAYAMPSAVVVAISEWAMCCHSAYCALLELQSSTP